MSRVLVADDLSSQAVSILRAAGLEVDVKVGLKPDELLAIVGQYDALAVRSATKVTAKVLDAGTRLKVVGRAGVGVDNVDLPAATRRGVVVMNTPGGSATTVAELALAMILSLSRHVAAATASVKAGKWEKKRFQGHELAGRTLGVVGIGNIGSVLVDRCLAMKMKVIAYDPFISPEAASKLGVRLVALEALWGEADVISLHVPLTDQTRHMVNADTLARMKPTTLLVNCARGGIVDEQALAAALSAGRLGGAALDVFEEEPARADHPLLKLDNVVLTPHLGASTEEAQAAVAVAIAEQLADYLKTGAVKNAVNVPSLAAEVLAQLGPYLPPGRRPGR
jgi:(S)-sulfolactate dehydrogenase